MGREQNGCAGGTQLTATFPRSSAGSRDRRLPSVRPRSPRTPRGMQDAASDIDGAPLHADPDSAFDRFVAPRSRQPGPGKRANLFAHWSSAPRKVFQTLTKNFEIFNSRKQRVKGDFLLARDRNSALSGKRSDASRSIRSRAVSGHRSREPSWSCRHRCGPPMPQAFCFTQFRVENCQ